MIDNSGWVELETELTLMLILLQFLGCSPANEFIHIKYICLSSGFNNFVHALVNIKLIIYTMIKTDHSICSIEKHAHGFELIGILTETFFIEPLEASEAISTQPQDFGFAVSRSSCVKVKAIASGSSREIKSSNFFRFQRGALSHAPINKGVLSSCSNKSLARRQVEA